MTAYARLQFSDVSETEREATRKALLRYCELDTLAMVMIWEAWKDAFNLKYKNWSIGVTLSIPFDTLLSRARYRRYRDRL